MPINTNPGSPSELLGDVASERLRIAELLHQVANGDDDALLQFAAACFGLAADGAEAVANLTVALADRFTPVIVDLQERLAALEEAPQ